MSRQLQRQHIHGGSDTTVLHRPSTVGLNSPSIVHGRNSSMKENTRISAPISTSPPSPPAVMPRVSPVLFSSAEVAHILHMSKLSRPNSLDSLASTFFAENRAELPFWNTEIDYTPEDLIIFEKRDARELRRMNERSEVLIAKIKKGIKAFPSLPCKEFGQPNVVNIKYRLYAYGDMIQHWFSGLLWPIGMRCGTEEWADWVGSLMLRCNMAIGKKLGLPNSGMLMCNGCRKSTRQIENQFMIWSEDHDECTQTYLVLAMPVCFEAKCHAAAKNFMLDARKDATTVLEMEGKYDHWDRVVNEWSEVGKSKMPEYIRLFS